MIRKINQDELGILNEKKDLYLQYDNFKTEKIHEKLGFKVIDQVYHYNK